MGVVRSTPFDASLLELSRGISAALFLCVLPVHLWGGLAGLVPARAIGTNVDPSVLCCAAVAQAAIKGSG